MFIPEYYFACGVDDSLLLDHSSHKDTILTLRKCLNTEIHKALADHEAVAVLQLTTTFASYKALPTGAWNHEVVTRVLDETRRELQLRLHGRHLSRRINVDGQDERLALSLVWARFHGSENETGYRQYWLIKADQLLTFGDSQQSSSEKFVSSIERAWDQQSNASSAKPEVTFHDQFYPSRHRLNLRSLWLAFGQVSTQQARAGLAA